MRQPQAEKTTVKKPASKEKKQLMMLGVLGIVLAIVLSSQFSGAEGDQALAADAGVTAGAGGPSAPGQPSPVPSGVPDNKVLSSRDSGEAITRSPFESFWNTGTPVQTTIDELPPPSVSLNGTITSGRKPVAVIDGQTRYLGDMISGWRLVAIGSRRISLESPTKSVVSIEMPLLRLAAPRRP